MDNNLRMEIKVKIYLKDEKQPIDFLSSYFQERKIFPMTVGSDIATWEEAIQLKTSEQIDLLEKIINDSHFHQNLPSDTITYLKERLEVIVHIKENPDTITAILNQRLKMEDES